MFHFSGSKKARNVICIAPGLKEATMKSLTVVGVVVLLLGLLSFVVPIPHNEDHSVKIGDAKVGVETQTKQTVPPWMSGIVVAAGILLVLAGNKKSA